ncbi:MAG: RluA family pseudouridine synthase [Dehalococcoidia bacterium]|nr:RluA family pseudouridine synthase [Dehalococcoidia bacterium]
MTQVANVETRTLRLAPNAGTIRLDKYVAQALPQLSRSQVQKLIRQGYVLVNEHRAKTSKSVSSRDKITVRMPSPPTQPIAQQTSLEILYEDRDVIVIHKPAGLVVHPAPGHPDHTLVNAILALCPSLASSRDVTRPGIVHRLDKDTSGLMVIAKSDYSRQHLVNQFKSHDVVKDYLVLVSGRVASEHGEIDAPIGRDPHNRKRMAISETGKQAKTEYRVVRRLNDSTLLDVTPRTGRTHQIRVHLSSIGHPVVGDPVYGRKPRCAPRGSAPRRQFVHAYHLGFRLPSTDQYKEFTCPLPADLQQILESLADDAWTACLREQDVLYSHGDLDRRDLRD